MLAGRAGRALSDAGRDGAGGDADTVESAERLRRRRDVFRAFGIATTAGAGAALLAACGTAPSSGAPASQSAPAAGGAPETKALRIGYLPITDATPLLLAHAQGLYKNEGLEPEKPTLFRGWAQIAEAFQARQVDVAHILMPTAVWMRFSQSFPVKLVAWNHTDGSALTVANNVKSIEDFAGKTVGIPFWYSVHNTVLQLLLRKAGLKPLVQGEPSAKDKTVKLVVMAPSDMPPGLSNGSIAGYIVADPFNAMA